MKLEKPIEDQEELRAQIPTGTLAVSEVFYSLQGEGRFTGRPMVFVRLNLCRQCCGFCDTSYTWKTITHNQFMNADEILNKVKQLSSKNRFVCITGGEPFEQSEELYKVCKHLTENGMKVQIETSGSMIIQDRFRDVTNHIVCSPKQFNGLNHSSPINEVKMLVTKSTNPEKLKSWINRFKNNVFVSLQPLEPRPLTDTNFADKSEEELNALKIELAYHYQEIEKEWEANKQRAIEIALQTGWMLSQQQHKTLFIR